MDVLRRTSVYTVSCDQPALLDWMLQRVKEYTLVSEALVSDGQAKVRFRVAGDEEATAVAETVMRGIPHHLSTGVGVNRRELY